MHPFRRLLRAAVTLGLGLLLGSSVLLTAGASEDPMTTARATVLEMVAVYEGSANDYCSAVAVAPGVAVTARHCVEGTAASLFLRQNDKLRPITGRAIDPARDVATITVPGLTCPCAPIAPTGAMALEADVIAIGYPWGGENTVTAGYLIGRVQVVNPDESDGILSGQYIAVLIRVEPGNSGGGLFVRRDGEWQLIGITSWGFTGGGDRRPAFFVEIAPWSS